MARKEFIMGKFYAVKRGHKPGIYDTWEECQKYTHGFSGAEFKKFTSWEDANNYIGASSMKVKKASNKSKQTKKEDNSSKPNNSTQSSTIKKTLYAVRRGRQTGIFEDWNECQKHTSRYPNAEYKKFNSPEDAQVYLGLTSKDMQIHFGVKNTKSNTVISENITRNPVKTKEELKNSAIENSTLKKKIKFSNRKAIAYVDGTFNHSKNMYGCGAIIIVGDKEIELMANGNDSKYVNLQNVAGELNAVKLAVDWCINNDMEEVVIYHDFEGISNFLNKEPKKKQEGILDYKKYCEEVSDKIKIRFVKVYGHSGDRYNTIADSLASASTS